MRPVADILADIEMPAPTSHVLADWIAFGDLTTPAELADVDARGWLEICAKHRAGLPLSVPPDTEADPRFDSVERFVLAAMLDVGRTLDMTKADAFASICIRIFGALHDDIDRRHVFSAVERLVSRGVLARIVSGGFVRRIS